MASTEEALSPGAYVGLGSQVDGQYLSLTLTALSDRLVEVTGVASLTVPDGATVRLRIWQTPGGAVLLDYATTPKVRHYVMCEPHPCAEVLLCFEPSGPDSLGVTACEPGSTP